MTHGVILKVANGQSASMEVILSMGKRKTQEEFIKELCDIYGITEDDFVISEYQGWDRSLIFICKRCGQSKMVKAESLRRKRGNKKNICRCYGYSEDFLITKKRFDSWNDTQKKYFILENFTGITKNILVKCKKCGAEQRRNPKSLVEDDSCLVCEKKASIRKTKEQFKKELYEFYGEEYELVGDYLGADVPTLFRHTLCGKIYQTKPHHILTNKGGHCPICGVTSKGEKRISAFLEKNKIDYVPQYRSPFFKKAPFDFYLPKYNLLIEFQGIQHYQPVAKFGGKATFIK